MNRDDLTKSHELNKSKLNQRINIKWLFLFCHKLLGYEKRIILQK